METFQQILLEQYKKKKNDTFISDNLSTFDHVIATLANDDMLARFRISF